MSYNWTLIFPGKFRLSINLWESGRIMRSFPFQNTNMTTVRAPVCVLRMELYPELNEVHETQSILVCFRMLIIFCQHFSELKENCLNFINIKKYLLLTHSIG